MSEFECIYYSRTRDYTWNGSTGDFSWNGSINRERLTNAKNALAAACGRRDALSEDMVALLDSVSDDSDRKLTHEINRRSDMARKQRDASEKFKRATRRLRIATNELRAPEELAQKAKLKVDELAAKLAEATLRAAQSRAMADQLP